MKSFFVIVLTVCGIHLVHGLLGGRIFDGRGPIFRRLSVLSERADIRENRRGGWWFPDDIEYSIDVDGLGVRHFLAKKDRLANKNPCILNMLSGGGVFQKTQRAQDVEYYTNADGSFACRPTFWGGQAHCHLMGIFHTGNESCFFKGSEGYCEEKIEGTREAYEIPEDPNDADDLIPASAVPYPGNRTDTPNQRQKRQITQVTSNTRIVQIAFFIDAAFMQRFYRLNPSNDAAAEEDAEMYIIMVANEMTYRYRSVKDLNLSYRGGILDLAVNPNVIVYPAKGTDFSFAQKDSTYLYSSTLPQFRNYINSNPPGEPFDHAMLVSGLNLYSSSPSLLGSAYVSSVCATNDNRLYRVSMSEDRNYNLADTAAHELGHALGALHDATSGNTCPSQQYIMSATATRPTSSTANTIFTFSLCSGQYFRNHLSGFPDCLSRSADNNFLENFCAGPRGLRATGFDYQCQHFYNYGPGYSECYGTAKVGQFACWRQNQIYCYPGSGDFCYGLPYLADGSPCDGPDSEKTYYCYLGDCVEEDEICSTPPPTPSPPPTTAPPVTPSPPPPQPPSCICDSFSGFFARLFCCLANTCC